MNVRIWFSSIVHRIRYFEYKWNIDIDWKHKNNNEKKISISCDEHALNKWYSEMIFKSNDMKNFSRVQNVI